MSNEDILSKIEELETQLTGNLFDDMDTKDEIHKLKMTLNNVIRPSESQFECVGCGS